MDFDSPTPCAPQVTQVPDTVVELDIQASWHWMHSTFANNWLRLLQLPSRLRVLHLPDQWYADLVPAPFFYRLTLPDSLRELRLPRSFKGPAYQWLSQWPVQLTMLGCSHEAPFKELPPLPHTITMLDTGGLWGPNMAELQLPRSLTELDWNFNQPISNTWELPQGANSTFLILKGEYRERMEKMLSD